MLEAFGNAKTVINNNGTRFMLNLDLFFEPFGGLVGAKLNTCKSFTAWNYNITCAIFRWFAKVTDQLHSEERKRIPYFLLAFSLCSGEQRRAE